MTYLGIDQSFSGFALVAYTPPTTTASSSFRAHVFDFSAETCGTGPARLRIIYHELHRYLRSVEPLPVRMVCYEGYAYGARMGREQMGELGGLLRLALVQLYGPECLYVVSPAGVKKFATGSGRAPKDHMKLGVYKKWGYEAPTHDVADAYTLARIAAALDRPGDCTYKYEDDVIATIRKQGT
ncbi:hypothetical protein ABZ543_12780 [Streptomyces roseifaciens]